MGLSWRWAEAFFFNHVWSFSRSCSEYIKTKEPFFAPAMKGMRLPSLHWERNRSTFAQILQQRVWFSMQQKVRLQPMHWDISTFHGLFDSFFFSSDWFSEQLPQQKHSFSCLVSAAPIYWTCCPINRGWLPASSSGGSVTEDTTNTTVQQGEGVFRFLAVGHWFALWWGGERTGEVCLSVVVELCVPWCSAVSYLHAFSGSKTQLPTSIFESALHLQALLDSLLFTSCRTHGNSGTRIIRPCRIPDAYFFLWLIFLLIFLPLLTVWSNMVMLLREPPRGQTNPFLQVHENRWSLRRK